VLHVQRYYNSWRLSCYAVLHVQRYYNSWR
jgi:hypothetical protein